MCSLTSKTDLSFPLAVPLSVMHRSINDTELQEYKIPQGSIIIPLLYSASYDPKYWVDAETFNPDRFINKTGKLIKNDALMPFSVGKYNPSQHSMLGHHLPVSETPIKWRFAGGLMMDRF